MVAIFDSPDYLITNAKLKNIGYTKKILYLFLGFIVGLIHKYFQGALFTGLLNLLLRRKVKLKYEKPFYIGVQDGYEFYFPNKRVTRLLEGIEEQTDDIFNL